MSESGITIALALTAVNWFALEARWAKPRLKAGYVEYSIPIALKALFAIVLPTLLYGAVDNFWIQHKEGFVSLLLLGIGGFCFYFIPPTILCSDKKVISVRWYGLKRVSFDWPDVVAVYSDPGEKTIRIQDKAGREIAFTIYNVGRSQFLSQLQSLNQNVL